jgi:hypothetical protein
MNDGCGFGIGGLVTEMALFAATSPHALSPHRRAMAWSLAL